MCEPATIDRNVQLRLLARLSEQAEEIRRLVDGLSEEVLARRPAPDKWSLKELVCHLSRVQQVFEGRVEAMLSEDGPAIVPYDPEEDGELEKMVARSAARALSDFLSARRAILRRLEGLSAAQWQREGSHPEFARFDVRFQIEYMAHHEAHHIYQIFQRRAQLGQEVL